MGSSSVPTACISVVMPVYNGENYVRNSIESVLNQTCTDFEFLITCDGCSDRTGEIVRSYKDERIQVFINKEKKGLFYNLNRLIEKSSSPLIKLWCQDDIMHTDCLETGIEFYKNYPGVGFFYANCNYIDKEGIRIQDAPTDTTPIILFQNLADEYVLRYGCLPGNVANCFLPRKIFDQVGPFREDWIAADLDILVRIQEKHPIGCVPKVLVDLRRHSRQWSVLPGSFIKFVREELQIYEILQQRILRKGILTEKEIQSILKKKYALNYFHTAVVRLILGRFSEALEVFFHLRQREPLNVYFLEWFRNLPQRILLKLRRFINSTIGKPLV